MHRYHCKAEIKLHFIFCTKYRKRILTGSLSDNIKSLLLKYSDEFGCKLDCIETDVDHVHMLANMRTDSSAEQFCHKLKMMSTYYIWRTCHAENLKQIYWKENTFWSDGYFVTSVGKLNYDEVFRYITEQNS